MPTQGTAPEADESPMWIQATQEFADNDLGGRDGDDSRSEILLGFEFYRGEEIFAGVAGGFEFVSVDSFGGAVSADAKGLAIGPYVGWLPNPNFMLDAWLGYERRDFDADILWLGTSFDTDRVFLSVNGTGIVDLGDFLLLPKAGVFLASEDIPAHSYQGQGSVLQASGGDAETVIFSASAELRRKAIETAGGSIVSPYARLGLDYYADTPGDGIILDADLSSIAIGDTLGEVAFGVDWVTASGGQFLGEVAYGGIGESGLDTLSLEFSFKTTF